MREGHEAAHALDEARDIDYDAAAIGAAGGLRFMRGAGRDAAISSERAAPAS